MTQQSFHAHVNAVAFADGEQVLSLNADRRGLLVTGTKDDHMFLRQARLACGDRQWHHIALDFPANEQRTYKTLIAKAMRVLAMADTGGCDTPTLKGAADKAKGAVKDAAGKVTGDRKLQTEGKIDTAKGAAHNVAGDVKDAVRKAGE